MLLFFRKKKGNLEANGYGNASIGFFRAAMERKQLKISCWLNEKTARCSPMQKKTGLALFCALFGSLSFYQLASSTISRKPPKHAMEITHLPPLKPLDGQHTQRDSLKYKEMMSSRMFENLKQLKMIYQQKNK